MSDMATLRVKNREFQRATGAWLEKARKGDTIVIVGSEGPPLTLRAGRFDSAKVGKQDWEDHFVWLKAQPILDENPVEELRRSEGR
jgi:hypothetical protein